MTNEQMIAEIKSLAGQLATLQRELEEEIQTRRLIDWELKRQLDKIAQLEKKIQA